MWSLVEDGFAVCTVLKLMFRDWMANKGPFRVFRCVCGGCGKIQIGGDYLPSLLGRKSRHLLLNSCQSLRWVPINLLYYILK